MALIDWSSVSLITSIKAKVLAVCESCSLRLGCMVTQKAKHSSQEWIIRLFKQFSPSFYTNKDYMEKYIHTHLSQQIHMKFRPGMLREIAKNTRVTSKGPWRPEIASEMLKFIAVKLEKDWTNIGYLERLLAESNFSLKTTWQHNVG